MRKYTLVLAALLVLPWLAGCGPQPVGTEVDLDEPFLLAPGESASVRGEDLTVRFVEVINDSRCPEGAVCIWAGEVSGTLEITYGGVTNTKVLVQPGATEPPTTDFADYRIKYDVQPYPQVGKQIEKGDYRLLLTISEKPALTGSILATFDVYGERYSIFITNQDTIEQVFALERGESQANIPSGRVRRGAVDYNRPWSWHIDSEEVGMAEFTIELCDGKPSQVEANLDYWVDTVQRFCPWGARLVSVEDYR